MVCWCTRTKLTSQDDVTLRCIPGRQTSSDNKCPSQESHWLSVWLTALLLHKYNTISYVKKDLSNILKVLFCLSCPLMLTCPWGDVLLHDQKCELVCPWIICYLPNSGFITVTFVTCFAIFKLLQRLGATLLVVAIFSRY